MPFCAMCYGVKCPKKNDCYRHRAKHDYKVTYLNLEKRCKESNNYNLFIEIDGREVEEIKEKLPEGDDASCVNLKMNETES